MSVSDLSDESLKSFYESIRNEVEADRESMQRGHKHFFAHGDAVKEYAASISAEMDKRRLSYTRIVWL